MTLCFFKQKTAYEMRISDWSSDVCSSDLLTVDARSPTSSWQQATTTLPSSRVLRTLQPVVIVRPDTVSDCYNTARESQFVKSGTIRSKAQPRQRALCSRGAPVQMRSFAPTTIWRSQPSKWLARNSDLRWDATFHLGGLTKSAWENGPPIPLRPIRDRKRVGRGK